MRAPISKEMAMRIVILALTLGYLSILATGATIVFPRIQHIEFKEPLRITTGSYSDLCEEYNRLFMDVLHKSLECSEDYGPPPHLYERCEELRRLLVEYSQLRSFYCYGEYEI